VNSQPENYKTKYQLALLIIYIFNLPEVYSWFRPENSTLSSVIGTMMVTLIIILGYAMVIEFIMAFYSWVKSKFFITRS